MKSVNMSRFSIGVFILSAAFFSSVAFGSGVGAGGGGSAWQCTSEKNPSENWIQTVDLFQARVTYGDKAVTLSNESVEKQVAGFVKKAASYSELFQTQLEEFITLYGHQKHELSPLEELQKVEDLSKLSQPSRRLCPSGKIDRMQVVHYIGDTANIDHFAYSELPTETDRAAIIIHEAIYRMRREFFGDGDATKSIQLVGCLVSSMTQEYERQNCAFEIRNSVFKAALPKVADDGRYYVQKVGIDRHSTNEILPIVDTLPEKILVRSTAPFMFAVGADQNPIHASLAEGVYTISLSGNEVSMGKDYMIVTGSDEASGLGDKNRHSTDGKIDVYVSTTDGKLTRRETIYYRTRGDVPDLYSFTLL